MNTVKIPDLLTENVAPASEEKTVRTYYCTYYRSRLLGVQASGHLGVTNKRVIFHANGESSAGKSIIQSELPISDVSGITSYKGTYFSLGHLALAILASFFFGLVLTSVINYIGWNSGYGGYQVIAWIVSIGAFLSSFAMKNDSIWRSVLAATSSFMAYSLAVSMYATSIFNPFRGGVTLNAELVLGIIFGLYALLCYFWYARRPTFSLAVSSKGGASTPITISGSTGMGILGLSAIRALSAEPADEAETMLKELGAVILDIQTLGDMGIKKWSMEGEK